VLLRQAHTAKLRWAKPQTAPSTLLRQARMATLRWPKPQTATSTQNQTATCTKTRGADGSKRRVLRSLARVIRVRRAIRLLHEDGAGKDGAAGRLHLPSAEAGGNRGRKVLEVHIAEAAVVAGVEAVVAGSPQEFLNSFG
jgi:transcriptional regulator of acetoin/glycerol metabolism